MNYCRNSNFFSKDNKLEEFGEIFQSQKLFSIIIKKKIHKSFYLPVLQLLMRLKNAYKIFNYQNIDTKAYKKPKLQNPS